MTGVATLGFSIIRLTLRYPDTSCLIYMLSNMLGLFCKLCQNIEKTQQQTADIHYTLSKTLYVD